jgi:hypothetical protein
MNMALDKFYKDGKISEDMAMEFAGLRSELRQMLRRTGETGTSETTVAM